MIPGVTPDGHAIPRHIAVVNYSDRADQNALAFQVEACNIQLREHCAPLWDAEPPQVIYYGTAKELDPARAFQIGIVNDDGNAESAGYHAVIGKIAYGLVDEGQSSDIGVILSHEVLEMYANAFLKRTVPWPGLNAKAYVELCDGVQRQHYDIRVNLFGNSRRVAVSDFQLPAWFGLSHPQRSTRTTWMNQKLQPYQIAPGGYQIIVHPHGRVEFLNAGSFQMTRSQYSRTARIWTGKEARARGPE